mmetsp:Transcript_24787/g.42431  ORF Transcript_24787/g.42431 Transcript_24787/m.42431 type:complete len:211 (+) Transcript_24787:49-681(+)
MVRTITCYGFSPYHTTLLHTLPKLLSLPLTSHPPLRGFHRKIHTSILLLLPLPILHLLHQKLFHRHAMSIVGNQNILPIHNHAPAPSGRDAVRDLHLFSRFGVHLEDSYAIPRKGVEEGGNDATISISRLDVEFAIYSINAQSAILVGVSIEIHHLLPCHLCQKIALARIILEIMPRDNCQYSILNVQRFAGVELWHTTQTRWTVLREVG